MYINSFRAVRCSSLCLGLRNCLFLFFWWYFLFRTCHSITEMMVSVIYAVFPTVFPILVPVPIWLL